MGELAPGAQRPLTLAIAGTLLVTVAALVIRLGTLAEFDIVSLAAAAAAAAASAALVVRSTRNREPLPNARLSDEFDELAQRLLRLEARVAGLDGSGSRADSTLADMAADMHSLSEVVRSLAEAMTLQEQEISQLKQRAERSLSFQALALAEPSGPLPSGAASSPPPGIPSFLPGGEFLEDSPPPLGSEAPAEPSFVDSGYADDVLAALAAGRIDLHVNPILALPQRRERLYDLYPMLRVSPDTLLVPEEFGPILDRLGGRPAFEAAVLEKATQLAERLASVGSDVRVAVSLSEASLSDPLLLNRLQTLVEEHATVLARLVVQVEQRAWEGAGEAASTFPLLRGAGMDFAVGGILDENLNPAALARRGVRYVRLSAERLVADGARPDMAALALALSRAGIEVIADAIDDDAVVPELLDLGIPLAQGLGLALPFATDPATDAAASGQTAPGREEARTPAAEPESGLDGPLRKFLRRAG